MQHLRNLKMSKKVKGLQIEGKSQKSYILVYHRDDEQKQLLCSYDVTFGLNLPSVKLRKEELDKLMSDLEDAVSEMESDTPKI